MSHFPFLQLSLQNAAGVVHTQRDSVWPAALQSRVQFYSHTRLAATAVESAV